MQLSNEIKNNWEKLTLVTSALALILLCSSLLIGYKLVQQSNITSVYDKEWRIEYRYFYPLWLGSSNEYETMVQYFALKNYNSSFRQWYGHINRRGFLAEGFFYEKKMCQLISQNEAMSVPSPFYRSQNNYSYKIMTNDCIYTHLSPLPYMINYSLFKLLSIDNSKQNIKLYGLTISIVLICLIFILMSKSTSKVMAMIISFSFLSSFWFIDFASESAIYSLELVVVVSVMIAYFSQHISLSLIISAFYFHFGFYHLTNIPLIPLFKANQPLIKRLKWSALFVIVLIAGIISKQIWTSLLRSIQNNDLAFYAERLQGLTDMSLHSLTTFTQNAILHLLFYLNPGTIAAATLGIVLFLKKEKNITTKIIILALPPFTLLIQFEHWSRHIHHISPYFIPLILLGLIQYNINASKRSILLLSAFMTLSALATCYRFLLIEPPIIEQVKPFHSALETQVVTFQDYETIQRDYLKHGEREKLFDGHMNQRPMNFKSTDIFIDLVFKRPISTLHFLVAENKQSNTVPCTIFDLNDFISAKQLSMKQNSRKWADKTSIIEIKIDGSPKAIRIDCRNITEDFLVYEIF